MNTKIKAICFDLDGIYFTPRGKQSFHRALSQEFGADPTVVDEVMYRSSAMRDLVTGGSAPAAFFEYLRQQTGITATDEVLVARWIQDYEIDSNVQKSVQSARAQGFLTCVCTNNNAARLPALEAKFGFYRDFDMIVSSHEVGFAKPHAEIFNVLLARLCVRPAELVYADDNADRLQGARDLGITVFVYENFQQFLAELQRLDITLL